MNLIEKTKRLADLEPEATQEEWFSLINCDARNHEISIESCNTTYIAEIPNVLPNRVKNAELICGLRNAAPNLLDVLGQFQPGDAESIEVILLNERQRWTDELWQKHMTVLERMRDMARLMEANHDL